MENQNTVKSGKSPEQEHQDHDIFTDPALQGGGDARDPVADFLKQQWRPVLIMVVLVFSAIYIRDTLRASHQAGLEASANSFFKAQEALEGYRQAKKKVKELEAAAPDTSKEKKADEEKALTDARADLSSRNERLDQAILVLNDALDPYKELTAIFSTVAAYERGDATQLAAIAQTVSIDQVVKANESERFVTELSLLTIARALLDSPENEAKGRELLRGLAENGQSTAVTASLTLARIASTDTEKAQAQELLKMLITKYPEQAALLKDEIA